MSPANGNGKPAKDVEEEVAEVNAEPTKEAEKSEKAKEAAEDQEEQFSPAELRKPVEETGISEEQKQLDRDVEKATYQTSFISASKKFNEAREEGKDVDEALEGIPTQIANKLRKIADGEVVAEPEQPDLGKLVASETQKVRLKERADDKFSIIVESAGLTKTEATAFNAEARRLESNGNDPLESVELASHKLGYSARKEVQEAEEKGLNRGLRAVPKLGTSPQSEKDDTTEAEQYYVDNQPKWLRK